MEVACLFFKLGLLENLGELEGNWWGKSPKGDFKLKPTDAVKPKVLSATKKFSLQFPKPTLVNLQENNEGFVSGVQETSRACVEKKAWCLCQSQSWPV